MSNATTSPSFLALHPSGDGDGRLLADEIYDLRLDADLVVLSACRTALGPVEGDGVIGFARAFLSAGARSVVATQWDVSDRVSYEVMREFYARRARGASKSRALRGAQLAVLRALRAGTIRADGAALPGDATPLGRLRSDGRTVAVCGARCARPPANSAIIAACPLHRSSS